MKFKKTITALMLLASIGVSSAQDKPVIKLLVGFPPGGAADNLARLLAEKIRIPLNQQVIIENKPGAGGRLAAQALKASPPNGQHYMVAPAATFTFQHLTYTVKEIGYDMTKDFTPVAQITSFPMTMVVNSSSKVKNLQEYVKWIKENPQKGNYGTAGAGGDTHFYGLQFSKLAGISMQVVPYRGNGPLVTDLVGNQIEAAIAPIGDSIQYIKTGQITPLAMFSDKRSPIVPEVPTAAEQGFDVGGTNGWMGMWGPAGLDPNELKRMQTALQEVLASEEVKKFVRDNFVQIAEYKDDKEITKQLNYELNHWGPIIKASGFTPNP